MWQIRMVDRDAEVFYAYHSWLLGAVILACIAVIKYRTLNITIKRKRDRP